MNRKLVGEPSVSAFLESVTRSLGSNTRMEAATTAPIFYDPINDLKTLNRKLASFQDLLVDGEARRLDEISVDGWMDDLKHLLYDVEDLLADIKSPTNDQVCFVQLKGTLDKINKRLIKILDETDVLVVRAKDLELKRGCGYAFSGKFNAIRRTLETSSTVDMSDIHGRGDDKRVIVERLMLAEEKGKKNYAVLCVVGMGGLGKTTLAQLVFNDLEVKKHFDVKSWVCISDVFDVTRATKELIQYLDGDGSSLDQQSLASIQRRLNDIVENKRFLFVLDDVWSSSEWEQMKAPFSSCANGSKILVTTRNIKIAQDLGDRNPYKLQGLPREHCMKLFRHKSFGDGVIVEEGEQEKPMMLGEKIVEACGGVPLAVKVIGSMLQGAEEEKWRAVAENADLWDTTHLKDEIHPAIRLSYHYLPASLKRCFEILAIFPTDHRFDQGYVVRLWIAEGLVQVVDGRIEEDIGNEYYNELKARSLIQENDMMHDIVHHFVSLVSRKFCYKENSKEPYDSVRHALVVNLDGQFLAEAPCLRTLIVDKSDPNGNDLIHAIQTCKMLRTLEIRNRIFHIDPQNTELSLPRKSILGAKVESNYADQGKENSILSQGETFMGNLTHLRYLTIKRAHVRHLPNFLCNLDNLQFLDLTANRNLETLPQEINHLSNLQYLQLCGSSVSSLPESICALGQLQVLDLHDCGRLERLPKDMGNIMSLRTLNLRYTPIISLPESICALSQLQVLDLERCRFIKQLPKDIGNLRSLRKLDLSYTSLLCLPESICFIGQLQVLLLQSCDGLKELPKDIGNLRSLHTIDLSNTELIVPESILNVTGLQELHVDKQEQLPLHIGRLTRLEALPVYHVRKEEGLRLSELNLMNSLRGIITIASMENIQSVEEASMADLKSKTNVWGLGFLWTRPSIDEEMTVKILEVLKPHHTLKSMRISNYSSDNFPDWIISSNICLGNLTYLRLEGLNKICEMVGMEFVSLEKLHIENCPRLRKILMATPKLSSLLLLNLGWLEAASVHFLPNLSHKVGMHLVVSQLKSLRCAYNIFEHFFEKLQTTDLKWDKLQEIRLQVGGARLSSLPRGWPIMMGSICVIALNDIGPGKFQFLLEGDETTFPPSIDLYINKHKTKDKLPRHLYTINSDGEIEI